MRSCGEYRAMARESLKGNWATFMIATVLYALASFAVTKISGGIDTHSFSLSKFGIPILISLLISVFMEAMRVGLSRMGLEFASSGQSDFSSILQGFQCIDKVLLWSLFYTIGTTLLTILCIVPGIIFAYTYAMVPFILADDPTISFGDALKMSSEMMKGKRFDLFVLQLSFIGWAILCAITCGIGNIALTPYTITATAHFYIDLKS